jgi:hypothetical protein
MSEPATATETLISPVVPGSADTCDACNAGVAALYLVILPSGGVLSFCRHHARTLGFVS